MSTPLSSRNLGTAAQAREIVGVTTQTLLKWVRNGYIHAVRVGAGKYLYDLDDVAAMIVEYPRDDDIDERIRELVDGAPEFSVAQINKIRLLLQATASQNNSDAP